MSKEIIQYDAQEAVALAEEKVNSISSVMQLKVVSTPTFNQAGEAMNVLRETKKFLKEKKDSILDPLNIAVKNIKSLFEPAETKCVEAEAYLKIQISAYNVKLQAEEKKRAEEAAKQIENGADIEKATKKMEKTQEKINKIPTRKVWRLKILDFTKVSNDFKVLDEQKALKAAQAGITVEGLEFYQEEIIVNRF